MVGQVIRIGFDGGGPALEEWNAWLCKEVGLALEPVVYRNGFATSGEVLREASESDGGRSIWAKAKSGIGVAANVTAVAVGMATLFALFSDDPPSSRDVDTLALVEGARALVEQVSQMECGKDIRIRLRSTKDESELIIDARTAPADIVDYCLNQLEASEP